MTDSGRDLTDSAAEGAKPASEDTETDPAEDTIVFGKDTVWVDLDAASAADADSLSLALSAANANAASAVTTASAANAANAAVRAGLFAPGCLLRYRAAVST